MITGLTLGWAIGLGRERRQQQASSVNFVTPNRYWSGRLSFVSAEMTIDPLWPLVLMLVGCGSPLDM